MFVEWHGIKVSADNVPMALPGAYLITRLATGQTYVGISQNVKKRIRHHLSHASKCTKLRRAFNKHGRSNFVAEPIYYSLGGTAGLGELEATLIADHDSIASGYNIVAAHGGVGPYGDAFGRAISATAGTPAARAATSIRMKKYFRDHPEQLAKLAESQRKAWLDPQIRAKRIAGVRARRDSISASIAALWEDPEFHAKQIAAITAGQRRPEVRERNAENQRARASRPEERGRLSRIAKAAMTTPESIERQSTALKAMWADPARRSALLASKKRAGESAETRARMSESAKARWADPEKRAALLTARKQTT